MTSLRFVLLCAEDDDLALVRWVHNARQRGLAPEVVSGVEHSDAPLFEALSDGGCLLFVLLRSEHMSAERMRQLKTGFAAHRRPEQRLVALRIEVAVDVALDRIAAELGEAERPRSEISMVISIEEVLAEIARPSRTATGSRPVVPSSPLRTPTGGRPTVTPAPAAAPAPSVAPAPSDVLRRTERRPGARRRVTTSQHEVTGRIVCDDETLPMSVAGLGDPMAEAPGRMPRAGLWIALVGMLGAGAAGAAIALQPASQQAPAGVEASPRDHGGGAATTPSGNTFAPADDDDGVVRIRVSSPSGDVEAEPSNDVVRRSPRRRDAARTGASTDASPTDAALPIVATPAAAPTDTAASPILDEAKVAVGAPPPIEPPAEVPVEPAPLEGDIEQKLPRR